MEDREQGPEKSMEANKVAAMSNSDLAEDQNEELHWEDSKIDTLPVYKVTHPRDPSELDAHIAMWMKCAASKASPPEGFVAATVYLAVQMRNPKNHEEFLFPEGPDDAEPIENLITESYFSAFGEEKAQKDEVAKLLRVLVPAVAMFCLRTVYHRNFRISAALEKAKENINCILGRYLSVTTAVSVSFEFGEALRGKRLAGSALANSALIPALKTFKKASEAGARETETFHMLRLCIVLSAQWYGLAVIERLFTNQLDTVQNILRNAVDPCNADQILAVTKFLNTFMSKDSKSFYHSWARALNDKFENQLSDSKMSFTTAVWTWLLTDNPRSPLWGSAELWTLDPSSIESAKKIAHRIRDKVVGEEWAQMRANFQRLQMNNAETPSPLLDVLRDPELLNDPDFINDRDDLFDPLDLVNEPDFLDDRDDLFDPLDLVNEPDFLDDRDFA